MHSSIRTLSRLTVVLLVVAVLFGCTVGCAPKSKETVVCALDWTPNTNHTGMFLAKDRGYYDAEGIDIEFRESDMNFIEMVANGSATFGIAAQEQVMQARASDAHMPIVAIAAMIRHNTSGFASPADRGIRRPKDFEGKTYSGWGTELELSILRTLMEKDGGDYDRVRIVNQSANNYIASMETEADFAWIFYGWDGIHCEYESYPIDFILLQDIVPDLDFYSPVLITNEATLEDNPELVRRFLRATAKGYHDAIADAEAGVDSLMAVVPEYDRALLLKSQTYLNPLYIDDAPYWGEMRRDVWEAFARWMDANGLLDHPIDIDDCFTNDFLTK
ncbi:MAG: ABC transporter substrate-binding protein [Saccharofermentanales bacterium]|jgi:ABC-type nitrate/sulfonate/bicarbonate transport system substrate-binding protein